MDITSLNSTQSLHSPALGSPLPGIRRHFNQYFCDESDSSFSCPRMHSPALKQVVEEFSGECISVYVFGIGDPDNCSADASQKRGHNAGGRSNGTN